MTLSRQSIETLIDLVEIKLGCIEVWDRDDQRAVRELERALQELKGVVSTPAGRARARGQASTRLAH